MTITLDPDVKKEAKEKIPNISKEFEEYLKIRLNPQNKDEYQLRMKLQAKQHLIIQTESEIEFLLAQLKNVTGYSKDQKEREGMVWRKLWSYYRETQQTHHKFMDPSVEVLKESEETLMELMNHISTFMERGEGIKVTDWDYVKEKYLPEVKR